MHFIFFSTLSEDHHNDFNLLVDAFRQNYTKSVEVLKTRLKAARQQLGQDDATILCNIRPLACRAYRDHPHLLEQIVVTSFNEGLNNSTLRWELRKLKPENADHALTKTIELAAYLEFKGRNPIGTASGTSAGANHMTNQLLTDNTAVFDEFVRSLKRDTDNMPHTWNRGSRDNSHSGDQDRNNSMDKRSQNDSKENTRSRHRNDTRVPETHACLQSIDKTIGIIHARDMDKDTTPENVGRNIQRDRFNLSRLATKGDKTAKT